MSMQSIRDTYGIPVFRHMPVRDGKYVGRITRTKGERIVAFFGYQWGYHKDFDPLELEYLIEGAWKRGKDFAKENER